MVFDSGVCVCTFVHSLWAYPDTKKRKMSVSRRNTTVARRQRLEDTCGPGVVDDPGIVDNAT